MQLSEYTPKRANRLEKLSLPTVPEPFGIKILWVRWISSETSAKKISRQKHKHSFYEAHFIFSGNTEYNISAIGNKTLQNGDGVIISPEISHTVKGIGDGLTKISIAFSLTEDSGIFSKTVPSTALFFHINECMLSDFNAIFCEAERKSVFTPTLIRDRIFSILCAAIRDETPRLHGEIAESDTRDVRIASAIRYIEDNKNLFLTCDDVARYCHFNSKYLNRIFKKNVGMTLLEYIHTVKTKEASRLLTETELSLDEIATCLGFSNEYYFNSFFKRTSGLSPGAYRKLIKKAAL